MRIHKHTQAESTPGITELEFNTILNEIKLLLNPNILPKFWAINKSESSGCIVFRFTFTDIDSNERTFTFSVVTGSQDLGRDRLINHLFARIESMVETEHNTSRRMAKEWNRTLREIY